MAIVTQSTSETNLMVIFHTIQHNIRRIDPNANLEKDTLRETRCVGCMNIIINLTSFKESQLHLHTEPFKHVGFKDGITVSIDNVEDGLIPGFQRLLSKLMYSLPEVEPGPFPQKSILDVV